MKAIGGKYGERAERYRYGKVITQRRLPMKPKTKIIMMEGTTELSNAELAAAITEALKFRLADSDFSLTQKVRVQVAQSPGEKQ